MRILKNIVAALVDRSSPGAKKSGKRGKPGGTRENSLRTHEQPRFSVIVSAYNSSQRIIPALASVLAQTYPAREIIVVGDGCTDDTGEVVRRHFGDRVRWINLKRNFGSQSKPNNRGIRAARGTHIAYLGHDDIWSPYHLAALADTIAASGADFAVSGAIFHAPEGAEVYYITGLFEDASAARSEFYPPSSFAHRRSIVEKIGMWGDPARLRAPVDADFLLRAGAAGCRFASTGRITVHKFAAGHRYLFYRFPTSAEQEAMVSNLSDPSFDTRLITRILGRAAVGATVSSMRFPDYSKYAPGDVYRAARSAKGIALAAPLVVHHSIRLPLETGPAALDWQPVETHPEFGVIRWSGRNPNPKYLLNFRIAKRFVLKIHLVLADAALLAQMRLKIDHHEAERQVEEHSAESAVLTLRPDVPLPVENGLVLTFETHRPGAPLPPTPIRSRRFALSGVEIVLD